MSNNVLIGNNFEHNNIIYNFERSRLDEFDKSITCFALSIYPKDEKIDEEELRIKNLLMNRIDDKPLYIANFYIKIYKLDNLTIKNGMLSEYIYMIRD